MCSSLASFAMLIRLGDKSLFNIACLRSALYCAMIVSFSPIWVVWVGVTTILTVGATKVRQVLKKLNINIENWILEMSYDRV